MSNAKPQSEKQATVVCTDQWIQKKYKLSFVNQVKIKLSFILNGISTVVRGGRRFFVSIQYCSTDLLYMCRCAVNKTPSDPRAQEGTRTTGNTMALIHGHLKAVHWGAKNTHLLLRSKHIAPKPRTARAPELVWLWWSDELHMCFDTTFEGSWVVTCAPFCFLRQKTSSKWDDSLFILQHQNNYNNHHCVTSTFNNVFYDPEACHEHRALLLHCARVRKSQLSTTSIIV